MVGVTSALVIKPRAAVAAAAVPVAKATILPVGLVKFLVPATVAALMGVGIFKAKWVWGVKVRISVFVLLTVPFSAYSPKMPTFGGSISLHADL